MATSRPPAPRWWRQKHGSVRRSCTHGTCCAPFLNEKSVKDTLFQFSPRVRSWRIVFAFYGCREKRAPRARDPSPFSVLLIFSAKTLLALTNPPANPLQKRRWISKSGFVFYRLNRLSVWMLWIHDRFWDFSWFFLFRHPDLDLPLLPGKNEETHPLKNREHPKYFRNVYGVM